jgi:AraC family transcriptional activator of pobA
MKAAQNLKDATIPTFLLYEDGGGEPEAEGDFVHIETIRARAGLHNWEIRPHRHGGLHQFLVLLEGGGRVDTDGRVEAFTAPTFIVVPATLAHGFTFTTDAEGFVLTVAERFLEKCLHRGGEPLAYPADVLVSPLELPGELALLRSAFAFLHQELPWRRSGRERATAACLDLVLVSAARRIAPTGGGDQPSRARILAGRFKALVNVHAAEGWSVQHYARMLGVSVEQLTRACRTTAGRSPMRTVHDRLLSEARRSLIYTAMSVQEIGFSLGFADPAYFTRFFAQREGCSPSQFRRAASGRGPD